MPDHRDAVNLALQAAVGHQCIWPARTLVPWQSGQQHVKTAEKHATAHYPSSLAISVSGQLEACSRLDGVQQLAAQGGAPPVVGQLEGVEAGAGSGQALHILAAQQGKGRGLTRHLGT